MFLRAGALIVVLYRVYRRLPAGQRRQLRWIATRHGISVASRYGPRLSRAVRRSRRPRA